MPWDAWWQQHHEDAKASFTHREYLELKFKKAEAASRIFTKHTGFYIVQFGGLCEQSMVIAEHWIRFWQKSNQTLQTYVGLIREVCRKNASQYFFMEYDDLRGTSDKELMDDLTL